MYEVSESPGAATCGEGVGYLFGGERALFWILDKSIRLSLRTRMGETKDQRLGDRMMKITNEFC